MNQLLTVFPKIDPEYLKLLLDHYKRIDINALASITDKLVQFGYPRVQSGNELLLSVIEVYPNMDLQYARELVLRHKSLYKIQMLVKEYPTRRQQLVSERDLFRSPEYITACRIHLLNLYPFHWESTIDAIMAENNHDYFKSKEALKAIKPGYIWKTILPFTKRREIRKPEMDHPILTLELSNTTEEDEKVAKQLNESEYQLCNQFIPCQCCFSDCVFEDLCQCEQSHLFCKDCVTQQVMVGMYDSGTMRGKPLKCMNSEDDCNAEIPMTVLETVLPSDLFKNYQATLFEKAVQDAGLTISQCPFCNYFEESPRIGRFVWFYDITEYLTNNLDIILPGLYISFVLFMVIYSQQALDSVYLISLIFFATRSLWDRYHLDALKWIKSTEFMKMIERPKPLVLNCKNEVCLKVSCTECNQQWEPQHKCFEQEKDSLRTFVEMAMSNALIRTCPSCNIRFSKVDGCNKMECPYCKYVMCYVCRQDIKKERYDHFCDHFRFVPGTSCTKCNKCDLYQKEADEVAIRRAAVEAERVWRERHPQASARAKTF